MNYKIKETHIVFENNKIALVATLWESNPDGSVRATYCTTKPISGYDFIKPTDVLNTDLFQKVAGYGMNLPDDLKKKFFPKQKNFER